MNEQDREIFEIALERTMKENEGYYKLSPLVNAIMYAMVENNVCTGERLTELSKEFDKKIRSETEELIKKQIEGMSVVEKMLYSSLK